MDIKIPYTPRKHQAYLHNQIDKLNDNGYKVNFDTKHVNCHYFDKPIFSRINIYKIGFR